MSFADAVILGAVCWAGYLLVKQFLEERRR